MSGNQADDKGTGDEPSATTQTRSPYWHKRYWYWMGRGCKPGEAARRATEDETPQVEFRPKKGGKR